MSAYTGWTFEVAWTSDPLSASPTWVDMTSRVRGSLSITRGRTAEQSDIQPGTLTATLDNADHQLTAGNALSSIDVQLGKRCRVRETVGATTYDRFTGYLTDIDPDVWTDSGAAQVRMTFTDRLDRLARSPAFVSTLGAQIMSSPSLRLYYPLNDATTPFQPVVGSGDLSLHANISALVAGSTVAASAMVQPNSVTGPPGEDVQFPNFQPIYFDPNTPAAGNYAFTDARNSALNVPVAAGETIAVSMWLRPDAFIPALFVPPSNYLQDASPLIMGDVPNDTAFTIYDFVNSGAYAQVRAGANTVSCQNTSIPFPREVWRLATARLTLGTGAFSLWVGSDVVLTSTLASPPASLLFTYLQLSNSFHGALGHVQVHVGVNAFPYAEHLAQVAVGMAALERQSTGQRVTTLAGYAGVTDIAIDSGGTQMQRATLANTTPGVAMSAAARAENADLYFTGAGTLRFRGRASRYNRAATVTIAKAWLDDGLRPRVDGPTYNTFDATRGASRARSVDAASVAAKGVFAGQLELDTMQVSELAALARWRTLLYAAQRVRVPALPITLLHQTAAVRAAVLALDIGDRADLGTPALNANPNFETSANNWTASNGAVAVRTTAQAHEGIASLLVTPDGSSFAPQVQSEEIAVEPLRAYVLAGWLRSTNAGTRKLGVFWYDSSHTFISSNEAQKTLSAGLWTQWIPTSYTSPATAAYARITSNDPGAPAAANTWQMDEITLSDPGKQAGMPADYPVGADKLVIEGYTEQIGEAVRQIIFVTSPVLALPAGTTVGLNVPGLAGSYVSSPDNAALDIVGDIDLRIEMTLNDWTSGAYQSVISKWNENGVNQRSYLLQVNDTGLIQMVWSNDGIAVLIADSTVVVPALDGARLAIRVTLDVDNGSAGRTITFYTAPTIAGPWTQLGTPVVQAGVTSIFNSTMQAQISGHSFNFATGADTLPYVVHSAEIRNGIAGTIVAKPDFTAQARGTTSFTDSAGRVWTCAGSATIDVAAARQWFQLDSASLGVLNGTGPLAY